MLFSAFVLPSFSAVKRKKGNKNDKRMSASPGNKEIIVGQVSLLESIEYTPYR